MDVDGALVQRLWYTRAANGTCIVPYQCRPENITKDLKYKNIVGTANATQGRIEEYVG
jgi:hypothetical protein